MRAAVRGTEKVEDYARLSYEIGAEEGEYDIQAPWIRKSVEFTGTEAMKSYGIGKLVVVECDLLDEKNGARLTCLFAGAHSALRTPSPQACIANASSQPDELPGAQSRGGSRAATLSSTVPAASTVDVSRSRLPKSSPQRLSSP